MRNETTRGSYNCSPLDGSGPCRDTCNLYGLFIESACLRKCLATVTANRAAHPLSLMPSARIDAPFAIVARRTEREMGAKPPRRILAEQSSPLQSTQSLTTPRAQLVRPSGGFR